MTSISQKSGVQPNNLVHCAISHRARSQGDFVAEIEIYSDMSTVRYPAPWRKYIPVNYKERGRIIEFSRRSRRRLIEKMLKKDEFIRPLFVTLTYTDESILHFPAARDYKRDIDCFNKRLQREYPGTGHIWRVEYEYRKSGALIGYRVPHFHLIVDGVLDDIADLRHIWRKWWHEIITDGTNILPSPRVDIDPTKSKRHAMYYVSKYVAKIPKDNNIADEHQHNYFDGRHWAVVGNWNTTMVARGKLTRQEFINLKRLTVRYLKSRGSVYARRLAKSNSMQGFSTYGLGKVPSTPASEATITRMLLFVTEMYRF